MDNGNKNLRTEIGEAMLVMAKRVQAGIAYPAETKVVGSIASILYSSGNRKFNFTGSTNESKPKIEETENPTIKMKVKIDTSEFDEAKEKLVRLVKLIKEAQSLINDMATQSDDSTTLLDLNNIKVQES